MPYPKVILPQADAACGKTFFADRRTADGHRIGLEVWNRATGRQRPGYRLTVYRCRRCGGFHLGQRPIPPPRPAPPAPPADEPGFSRAEDWMTDEAGDLSPGANRPLFSPAHSRLRARASGSVSPTPSP